MIAVVVTLCHLNACVDERKVVEGTPMACLATPLQQVVISGILLAYPGWRVKAFHCEPADLRRT